MAILGSDSFNVSQVDLSSLTFGRTGTENSLIVHKKHGPKYELRDVNGDGFVDLVVYVKPSRTGLAADSTTATLSGRLLDGQAFSDSDSVTVTNSKSGKGGQNGKGNRPTATSAFDSYFEELGSSRRK